MNLIQVQGTFEIKRNFFSLFSNLSFGATPNDYFTRHYLISRPFVADNPNDIHFAIIKLTLITFGMRQTKSSLIKLFTLFKAIIKFSTNK